MDHYGDRNAGAQITAKSMGMKKVE